MFWVPFYITFSMMKLQIGPCSHVASRGTDIAYCLSQSTTTCHGETWYSPKRNSAYSEASKVLTELVYLLMFELV